MHLLAARLLLLLMRPLRGRCLLAAACCPPAGGDQRPAILCLHRKAFKPRGICLHHSGRLLLQDACNKGEREQDSSPKARDIGIRTGRAWLC